MIDMPAKVVFLTVVVEPEVGQMILLGPAGNHERGRGGGRLGRSGPR